ncbi:hypothetical protein WJX82_001784 [Trebouxia sp. C0006]
MEDFDARWLYKMTSIESLVCTTHGAMSLDSRLTQLSKLKDLRVSPADCSDDEWKISYRGLRYTQHEGQPLLAPSTQERGKFFLFYSYSGISGGPLLAALVSGEAAEAIDKVPAGEAVAEAMTVLKGT